MIDYVLHICILYDISYRIVYQYVTRSVTETSSYRSSSYLLRRQWAVPSSGVTFIPTADSSIGIVFTLERWASVQNLVWSPDGYLGFSLWGG